MCVNFVLLAESAALNILADKGGESGPSELGSDQLSCFQEAGMPSGFMIVAPFKDGVAKGIVCGDIDTAFIGEDAGFDLPVGQLGAEGERNILVHGLEGLENEGVSRGCGFNVVGEGGVNQVDKEGRREEGDVSVVGIVRGEEVGSAREGIRTSKKFTGDMDHFEVEVGEVNEPACLAAVECLGLAEIGEVFVVGEDLHRERGSMEVMAPGLQGADDGEEFTIIQWLKKVSQCLHVFH